MDKTIDTNCDHRPASKIEQRSAHTRQGTRGDNVRQADDACRRRSRALLERRVSGGLTESKKFAAQFITVATVDPDCCRALRYIDIMSAFTVTMPANETAWTAKATCALDHPTAGPASCFRNDLPRDGFAAFYLQGAAETTKRGKDRGVTSLSMPRCRRRSEAFASSARDRISEVLARTRRTYTTGDSPSYTSLSRRSGLDTNLEPWCGTEHPCRRLPCRGRKPGKPGRPTRHCADARESAIG